MSYQAKVYKVFIASPSDVLRERNTVRSVIAHWNSINAESQKAVLLPIGWDTHSAPESSKTAQDYINEEILDTCDILIGIFWTKVGNPTKNFESGTINEIDRHISDRKLAMLYFSQKAIPFDADLKQVNKVRILKDKYRNKSLYGEFLDENDLAIKLYDHLQIKMKEKKFKPTYDSDILAKIKDDEELVKEIKAHYPLVSRNLLMNIVDEARNEMVWYSIVDKLVKSPADLRETLIFLAKRGAFKHKVFVKGYKALAETSQPDFGNFMNALYSINRYEFFDIYEQGLLEDSVFSRRLMELIKINENR